MSKKLQLTIAEPCHENWENMSPVEKGKFCSSCEKEVVDFSYMSDRQVAEFFKKPSNGSVCGRFMSDQLDREIEIPKKRIPFLKYFFSFLLPAIFISKASAQQKMGKVRPATKDTTRRPIDYELRTLGLVAPNIIPVCKDTTDNRTIKGEVTNVVQKVTRIAVNGKVVNENGEAIPNVSVKIINNGKIIMADEKGKFSFHTTKDQLIELELTSVGYKDEQYIYPFTLNYSGVVDVNIQMKAGVKEMDEVVCHAYVLGGVRRVVTSDSATVTIKKDTVVVDPIKGPLKIEPTFLVYPNPVEQGASINISFKNLEEGYYILQILGMSGQLIIQKDIWIDAEATVMSMEAPRVATGTYFVILVNKKSGRKFTEKIVIN